MARLSSRPYKEEVDKVMDLLVKGWQIIFYDVETTGLKSKTSKILSLSAIKYKYEDSLFKEVDRLNVFINPCLPIPEEASKVNGITNEKVKDEMDEWDTHEKIIRPFFGDNPILVRTIDGIQNPTDVKVYNKNFNYIYSGVTNTNTAIFYAYKRPLRSLKVGLKGV